jgi:two-component system OmpR family response regulator
VKILLIEGDAVLADHLLHQLQQAGHATTLALDGRQGLLRATGENWDLIILDRLLLRAGRRGVVQGMRREGVCTPILLLTTLTGLRQCSGELDGADDFLITPFDTPELEVRIAALCRRSPRHPADNVLRVADLELDLPARQLRRGNRCIELKPLEFRLLEYLIRRANRVVTRQMLLRDLWDGAFGADAKVVESQVSRLRAKIEGGRRGRLIRTVHGAGYCLHASA